MNYRLHGDQTKRNAKGMLMIYIQTCYINWIQTQNSCVTDKMRTDDHIPTHRTMTMNWQHNEWHNRRWKKHSLREVTIEF